MIFLWLGLSLAAVCAEIFTRRLLAVWFVPAGISAGVLCYVKVDPLICLAVFFGIGLVGILLSHTLLRSLLHVGEDGEDITGVVGKSGVVTEKLDSFAGSGEVRVGSLVFAARTVDDSVIVEVGERVQVLAVEGVRLVCRP